ncbi:TIGR02757 family protein [Sulfurimonas sp. HSL3-7]|uniref:TIGR02757 family protein n=1 Tax=Sulfonitrofixus jiaomeiensis TaxID=3131938 RepID=UPI0031F8FA8F
MNNRLQTVKMRLDLEVAKRNSLDELHSSRPDPIMPAREHREEYRALICALFGYGRADSIIKFLYSLDLSLLESSESEIGKALSAYYYRFQNSQDVIEIFRTLHRLKKEGSLESFFYEGYRKEQNVLTGLNTLIGAMSKVNTYKSRGYDFLVGKPIVKSRGNSAMKRWMMYLRWMVRKDNIDMGLWTTVDKKDLIMPLDTHTFNISRRLGLLQRKSYDLEAALELTETLRGFDKEDPVKYDFALYRIGQEKML